VGGATGMTIRFEFSGSPTSTTTVPLINSTSVSIASTPCSRASLRTSASMARCSIGLGGRPAGFPEAPGLKGRPGPPCLRLPWLILVTVWLFRLLNRKHPKGAAFPYLG
jgi:hypothetical protein